MLSIPNMVMIAGNSRNSGKTTLACSIISKLSVSQQVVGLKVTAIRPGEADLHGTHSESDTAEFSIFEEPNPESGKDTSKMLRAGATKVFYIRADDNYLEKAILHFLSKYINNQIIVCESRSLRRIITPGLFLVMIRLQDEGKTKKDIAEFLSLADGVFNYSEGLTAIEQFVDKLHVKEGKFVLNDKEGMNII